MDLSNLLGVVGKAAEVAGGLGEKAYNLAKGVRVPGGITNAARQAYESAKGLKLAMPGPLATNAFNAAKRLTQKVKNGVNPQAIANSASKAANAIGQVAQRAGNKMAQLGSTIQGSGIMNTTRKIGSGLGNWFKGAAGSVRSAVQGVGQGLMAPSPYAFANPFYRRTVLDDVIDPRNPYSLASATRGLVAPSYTPSQTVAPSYMPTQTVAPMAPSYMPTQTVGPPIVQVPVPVPVPMPSSKLNVNNVYANMNKNKRPTPVQGDLVKSYRDLEAARKLIRGKTPKEMNSSTKARELAAADSKIVDFINNIPDAKINMKDEYGGTLLDIAANYGSTIGIDALCKRGADPTHVRRGESLLSVSSKWSEKYFAEPGGYSKFMAAVNSCKPPGSGGGRGGVKKRNRTFRKKSRKGTRRR